MPKKRADKLTQKEKESWFVSLYIRANATPDTIADCERRATLKPGSGKSILERPAVKRQIQIQLEPIIQEQLRQESVTKAVAKVTQELQEKADKAEADKDVAFSSLARILSVPYEKLSDELLEHHLVSMIVGLDMHKHPKEKLDSIKAGYVVKGTLASGSMTRLIPSEASGSPEKVGIYTSLFNRTALGAALEPSQSDDGVFDLIPRPTTEVPSGEDEKRTLPQSGDSIDEPAEKKPVNRIRTIEIV